MHSPPPPPLAAGHLQGEDRGFAAVSSDTRTISSGDLFVALQGPRFDGHDFLDACQRAGAAGAIVSRPLAIQLPQIIVKDTLAALITGRYVAQSVHCAVGRVAGSNGKTTVKK